MISTVEHKLACIIKGNDAPQTLKKVDPVNNYESSDRIIPELVSDFSKLIVSTSLNGERVVLDKDFAANAHVVESMTIQLNLIESRRILYTKRFKSNPKVVKQHQELAKERFQ